MTTLLPDFVYSKPIVDLTNKAQIREKRTREQKLSRRAWLFGSFLAVSATVNVVQAGSIRLMLPLDKLLPIILWRHDNGVVETAITKDSLPINMEEAAIKAFLWNYTWYREMYSTPMFDMAHYVVNAMSTKSVAEDYNKWSGWSSNPQSYQHLYGPSQPGEADRCRIIITYNNANPHVTYSPPGPKGTSPGRYIFRLWRLEQCRDEPPQHATQWTAAIDFVAGYTGSLDIHDVMQFNPFRIVVTNYAPLKPEKDGAQ